MITDKIKEQLERFLPMRVVIRKTSLGYEGRTEESWNMAWSQKYVQIYWSGKAYSMLGEHDMNGVEWAEGNTGGDGILFDPLNDECPINVNWEKWLTATSKYDKRNAPFIVKSELVEAVRKAVNEAQSIIKEK